MASSGFGSPGFNEAFGTAMAGMGAAGLLGGLFGGDPSKPYKDASKQLTQYTNQAATYQNPFYNAGTAAIPQYQKYLSKMSDPTKFINDIMGGYSQSPYSEYEQEQAIRAANNMASSSGLTGSTPLMLQEQENAENISNKDMETWLNHVLGINTQYGQGLEHEVGMGEKSANSLSRMYEMLGQEMAKAKYGEEAAKNSANSSMFGDLGSLISGALIGFGL
ncbi:MAG TPA: hypothetical protein VNF93_02305 [Buchnera sp. (in: enterobacteria)]|nr:hypothetical protein [Buchnera sp. (in: enterobacteria)]